MGEKDGDNALTSGNQIQLEFGGQRERERERERERGGGEIVCRAGAWFVEPGIEKTSPIAARNNLGQLDVGISGCTLLLDPSCFLDFQPRIPKGETTLEFATLDYPFEPWAYTLWVVCKVGKTLTRKREDKDREFAHRKAFRFWQKVNREMISTDFNQSRVPLRFNVSKGVASLVVLFRRPIDLQSCAHDAVHAWHCTSFFSVRRQRGIRCFWQTNLSRDNDGAACLTSTRNNEDNDDDDDGDGDDVEANGMCPIISQTENVTSRQRLALVNSLQRSPLFAFSSPSTSLSPSHSLTLSSYRCISISVRVRHLCLSNHPPIRSLVYSLDLARWYRCVGEGVSAPGFSLPLRNQDRRGSWIAYRTDRSISNVARRLRRVLARVRGSVN